MRELVPLAEPAESPMETRLRWVLVRSGVPPPQVQAELTDGDGRFLARVDMYYASARLVVEYDGSIHRDRLFADDRRQNQLVNAGYTVLRFTSADMQSPELIVAQVRGALMSGPPSGRFVQKGRMRRAEGVRFVQKGPMGGLVA